MSRSWPIYIATIFFMALALDSHAQSWSDLYNTADDAYQKGNYPEALSLARKSLETYKQQGAEVAEDHASILRLLENICYGSGDFKQGIQYVRDEITVRENKKDVQFAEALTQRAAFEQALEDYTAAELTLLESLDVLRQFYQASELPVVECNLSIGIIKYLKEDEVSAYKIFQENIDGKELEITSTVLQSTFYYGIICTSRGEIRKALDNFSRIKVYYESINENQSVEYAALLTSIAYDYHLIKQWEEAEKYYSDAQRVYGYSDTKSADYFKLLNARAVNFQRMGSPEKADALFVNFQTGGAEGSALAVFLSNKAALSQASGDYLTAEKLYQEALSKLDKNDKSTSDVYQETMQNLAMLYADRGNIETALKVLDESEQIASQHAVKNPVPAKIRRGTIFLKAFRKAEAMKLFNEALILIEQNHMESSSEWVMALNGLGAVLQQDGNIRRADSAFQILIRSYSQSVISKDQNYPAVLNNYATVKQAQGQFLAAHSLFRESANFIRRQVGISNAAYATALENLAYVDLHMGMLTIAKFEIDSALNIYEKILGKNSIEYASGLLNLGRYYQNTGEYPAAEPCFRKAYTIIQENKTAPRSERVRSINSLAVFYQVMGNYEEAEPLFKQALKMAEQANAKNTAEYSTTLQNMATLYQMQAKYNLARPLLEQSLAIDEKVFGDDHPQYAIGLKNLSAVYQKIGQLENAQVLLQRALQVTENIFGREHPSYAVTISNLAALYQDRGNFKEAEKAWLQSVTLRKKILGEQHPDYARSLYGLAGIYFAQGNFIQANQYFQTVVNQYLKQIRENFPSLSEKEKGAFYLKIKPVFESYQDFCMQYHKIDPGNTEILLSLYNVQLTTKAILLNASNKVRQSIQASGDTTMINSYRKWLTTKEQILRYYTLSVEERTKQSNVAVLERKANELEKHLSSVSTLFTAQLSESEITAEDVRGQLKDDEVAVEIIRVRRKFKADSIYYIGLILRKGQDKPSLVIWPNGAKLEARMFKYHRNAIKYMLDDTSSYTWYWKPLAGQLNGIRKVYLSCDGIFNKVNLNTLQSGKDKRWVLDDFVISLVSNTKELMDRNTSRKSSKEINLYGFADFHLTGKMSASPEGKTRSYGFGDDIPVLPATAKEIDEIGKLMLAGNWNVRSFKQAEANEINVKKTNSPEILHIATHGFFLNDLDLNENAADESENFFNNPLLRSGLLLAGAGVKKQEVDQLAWEDGVLTAYETMNLSLDNTDLVILSACETGLGEVRNGEGVYGLQRSFQVAGAGAVIMSLWQVDDVATQELMVEFYKNRMNGDDKLQAFIKAQMTIKEKYKSPYYWGAFILIGS